jgi:hypothetical protein
MDYEPESEWFVKNTILTEGDHNVYVDLGAAHPTNKSLTSLCRNLGWRGLAVDANSDYANDWAQAGFGSHFVCAVLSDQSTARFVTHENSFTSRISDLPETDRPEKWGIKRIEERITVPLNALLEMHGIEKVDLLCCDLEGFTSRVLKMLDFEKHQPGWVIAEYVSQGEGTDPEVCNFLLSKGYEVVHMTESNLIFRRKV